ncbi:hypothetical protein lerEdw1_002983 [Lerista edwardsae]|nr:hypothetical protein lerEdw1_002983 [Lerista edwardsae]
MSSNVGSLDGRAEFQNKPRTVLLRCRFLLPSLMFRSRRASLVQQLWRRRCLTPGPDDSHGALKPAAHALFKKLKDKELELLLRAVESRGAGESRCVWVEPRGAKLGLPASLLLCRLYRWPDLRQPHELKRLSCCKSAGGEGGTVHCCNPHHLSRLAAPETPPPPYCKASPFGFPLKCPKLVDNHQKGRQAPDKPPPRQAVSDLRALGQCGSRALWEFLTPLSRDALCITFSQNTDDTSLSQRSLRDGCWCKLAYWEFRLRVGRLFPVHEESVNVFSDLPAGSGFCLGQLASRSRSQAVQRARGKIGQGLVLSREGGSVWAYNRSEHPIFVSSPTLGPSGGSPGPAVHKILPGYSVKVFDYERAAAPATWQGWGDGPCDAHTLRISFAKGWGPCYSRRYITSCPCWLEVLLIPG